MNFGSPTFWTFLSNKLNSGTFGKGVLGLFRNAEKGWYYNLLKREAPVSLMNMLPKPALSKVRFFLNSGLPGLKFDPPNLSNLRMSEETEISTADEVIGPLCVVAFLMVFILFKVKNY